MFLGVSYLKESVFDICCSVGGRQFQAAGAPYENGLPVSVDGHTSKY